MNKVILDLFQISETDFLIYESWIHFLVLIAYVVIVVSGILLLLGLISIFSSTVRNFITELAFKVYRNWNSAPKSRNIIITSFILLFLISVLFFTPIRNLWPEFFGALTSTLITFFIGYLGYMIVLFFEDRHKVSNSIEYLKKYYGENYINSFKFNDKSQEISFIYDINYKGEKSIEFKEAKDEYKLPDFIEGNFQTIFGAHKGSYKRNDSMLRINDFIESKDALKIIYQKTTLYNHLVTNRAIDLSINKAVTIRDIFEYGPKINDLKDSVLSNHLGIVCIIETKDNKYIFNHRSMTATTSKNKIVASLAFGLKYYKDEIKDEKYIENQINEKIKNNFCISDKTKITSNIIGFGRDIHEGGKPNVFYKIKLDINSKDLIELIVNTKKVQTSILDSDDCIIVVAKDKIEIRENSILLIGSKIKNRKVVYDKIEKKYEVNLIALLSLLDN